MAIRDGYDDPYAIPYGPGDPPSTPDAPPAPSNPWSDAESAAATAAFQNYLASHQGYGEYSDGLNFYQRLRREGQGHDQALAGAFSGLGWNTAAAGTTDPRRPDPGPPPGGGSGGSAPTGGTLIDPYTGTFNAPPMGAYPDLPGFTPPSYTPPPAFSAPSSDEVLNDPGYQFASNEGERALEQSAAKRGVLNTGGTLKDILAWGGNYAQQRYGDVYDRKKDIYNTNLQTQYRDPYEAKYRSALDMFAPQLAGWQTNMQATQRDNENTWSHAFDLFNFDYNKFRDQRDSTWNKKLTFDTL